MKNMGLKTAIAFLLEDLGQFCEHGSGLRLRRYQAEAGRAIAESVLKRRGLTFVVMFPRQSGKNELQAQIEAYLLAALRLEEAEIVKISPTWKPQSLNAMRRLERVLSRNVLTRKSWRKEQGYIYRNGQARVFFLSGAPTANIIGATASTLLECDEAQDVSIAKWDKEISPMAASTNATRVFWGTAWTSQTLLARERQAALEAEKEDGIRRVFQVRAEEVGEEVPAYASYVREQVRRLGRSHPFIRTQYFSEESEPQSGMFPGWRRAMMRGTHGRLDGPREGRIYAFLMDVGGEDGGDRKWEEAVEDEDFNAKALRREDLSETDCFAKSARNDSRDSSALTIVEVEPPDADLVMTGPRYRVVQRRLWTGVGQARLYAEVKALAEVWQPRKVVVDATGLGAGLASFLGNALGGGGTVVPFVFTQKSKSDLGWAFLAVVDGGRFKTYVEEDDSSREFERQLENCQMEILPGPERRLRWGTVDGAKDLATGTVLHDDLVISAALCAALERMRWGRGESAVVEAEDPFGEMREIF